MISSHNQNVTLLLVLLASATLHMACTRDLSQTSCEDTADCYLGEVCIEAMCELSSQPPTLPEPQDAARRDDGPVVDMPQDMPSDAMREEEDQADIEEPQEEMGGPVTPRQVRATKLLDLPDSWLPGPRAMIEQDGAFWILVLQKDHLHLLQLDAEGDEVTDEVHIEKGFKDMGNVQEHAALFGGNPGELHVLYRERRGPSERLHHVRIDMNRKEIIATQELVDTARGDETLQGFDLMVTDEAIHVAWSHQESIELIRIEQGVPRGEASLSQGGTSKLEETHFASNDGDTVCGTRETKLVCYHRQNSTWSESQVEQAQGVAHLWAWPRRSTVAMIQGDRDLLHGGLGEGKMLKRRGLNRRGFSSLAMAHEVSTDELAVVQLDAQGAALLHRTAVPGEGTFLPQERFEATSASWRRGRLHVLLESPGGKGAVTLYTLED